MYAFEIMKLFAREDGPKFHTTVNGIRDFNHGSLPLLRRSTA